MRSAGGFWMVGALALLAACVPQPSSPPPPPPAPAPVPPPIAPAPRATDWRDLPLSRGAWAYRSDASGSEAMFGPSARPSFALRCDRARREIALMRDGLTSGNVMTIRTSSGARNFPLSVRTEPTPIVTATVSPSDRFLDSMAFSRGRFTVEVPGTARLVIPAWPEPARVIEDCRG
jgi:hypothetical protein